MGTHTRFGEFVLFVNVLTAASFLISDFFFNRREQWLIEWLDVDDEFPSTHLPHVLDRYPHIKKEMWVQNARCAAMSTFTAIVVICNFVVSAVFVLRRVGHEEKVCCPGIFPGGAWQSVVARSCVCCAHHAALTVHDVARRDEDHHDADHQHAAGVSQGVAPRADDAALAE
jgi:hypothetical protein